MTSIYSDGTVSVTNDDAVVTGSGTAWAVALVTGGSFSCAGLSIPIVSVESDTSLTLAYPWPGATATGAAYAIQRDNSDAASVVDLYDRLSRVLVTLSLVGIHPDNSGSLAKRDALTLGADDDNYLFLRAELGVEFAFYRWDGPSLAWIGPFTVADAVAGGGVSSIVQGTGIAVDNTNPAIPVISAARPGTGKAAPIDADEVSLFDSAASFVLKRLTWANLKATLKTYLDTLYLSTALARREVLTAARTYYVRPDGNDSNNGLANTSGGAFLTLQKAIDTAAALDLSIYDVTIQLADGTYSTPTGSVLKSAAGAGAVNIVGNLVSPGSVVITTTGAMTGGGGIISGTNLKTTYRVSGVKFTSTATGTVIAINLTSGTYLEYGAVEFGSGLSRHIQTNDSAYANATSSYTISAGAAYHVRSVSGEIRFNGITITLTGTPAFSAAFAEGIIGASLILNGATFSGSATGVRYNATTNSVIYTAGAGATYLPGGTSGTTSTGGQYT